MLPSALKASAREFPGMVDRWMGIDVEREGDADNKSNAVARGKRGGKKEKRSREARKPLPCFARACFRGSGERSSILCVRLSG